MAEMKTKTRSATRAEKQEETRLRLLTAAANQIGIHGYAGASIQKITGAANVANGTFYNYFDTQQDLFDTLLPKMGNDLLNSIRNAVAGEKDGFRREKIGFRAFFDYLAENPSFYRVLNEAEVFAPKAYRDHMENMAGSYVRALEHNQEHGELTAYSSRELEVIAYILISARNYLSYRYCLNGGNVGRLPDWVAQTYMKFLAGGVAHDDATSRRSPAFASPIGPYQTGSSGPGFLELAMAISDEHLDGYGQIGREVVTGLIDRAGAELAANDYGRVSRTTSLSIHFLKASHARSLTARVTCTASHDNAVHLSTQVLEQGSTPQIIATGQLVLTLDPRKCDAKGAPAVASDDSGMERRPPFGGKA